ncbi:MAG: hypothetical protein JWP89_1907 [Schlesneria sp.]|nr:hypothetical protein [Schlesneria sp.]
MPESTQPSPADNSESEDGDEADEFLAELERRSGDRDGALTWEQFRAQLLSDDEATSNDPMPPS